MCSAQNWELFHGMEVVCLSKSVEIILGGYDPWCNFFGLKTVWFFFCKSLWHTITDVTLKIDWFLVHMGISGGRCSLEKTMGGTIIRTPVSEYY